jgi:glycosyltransferase involved in cell wall biosynthesis
VRRPRLDRLLGGVDVLWAPAPAPLAVSPGVPLVLTVHDRSFEVRPGDFTRYERLWHRLTRPRALAARADAVVCDAAAVRADLERAWGVRATVVAPGVLGARAPAADADGTRPYLLFVGALEPRKGPDVLAAAYARPRTRTDRPTSSSWATGG